MCLAALTYYPKTAFHSCYSSPSYWNLMQAFKGVEDADWTFFEDEGKTPRKAGESENE